VHHSPPEPGKAQKTVKTGSLLLQIASWKIEEGMTPLMTAFLIGNKPETAFMRYTHQMSLPTEIHAD
jgi:hypothetical protein